ncbi:MAG: MG2 domain-containing protein, partial [Anaerolineae bacterium]
ATAGDGRWLAFRAEEPLPPATQVTVVIGPGTPSAEGPLTTDAPQSVGFSTYGPLQVVDQRCGWGDSCTPLAPWTIRFSNPLDENAFQEGAVRISPELPAANVNVSGDTIVIQGRSSGRTTYQVTLSKEIADRFGQTLGKDVTLSFKVGSAEPVFWAPGGSFVVVDPTAMRPAYSVYTINYDRLNVQAYAVQPSDWEAWKAYLTAYYSDKPLSPPGKQLISKTIAINARADELTETAIDLTSALPEGLGQVVLIVEPDQSGLKALLHPWQRPPVAQAWVQATHIGLDAAVDDTRMVAWANSLAEGAPLSGVEVTLLGKTAGAGVKTGYDGVATLPLPDDNAALLVGRRGGDVAILPADTGPWSGGGWSRTYRADSLRWYTFDDRGIYRPGEEVHLKGWIRRVGTGPAGDVGPLMGAADSLRYRMLDSRGNEILNGATELNPFGGFTLAFTLTETMNLGPASIELTAQGGMGGVENTQEYHTFQVEEFRRPEYEVKTTADEGPYLVGDSATVEVSATYYAGGGLPDAEVDWTVRQSSTRYSPPGWDDFTFGTWVPWWRDPWYDRSSAQRAETFTGRTDASGVHRLQIDF